MLRNEIAKLNRSRLSGCWVPRGLRQLGLTSVPVVWDLSRLAAIVTNKVTMITRQAQKRRDLRHMQRLAAVDERHLVLVQRMQQQLDADEHEDDGQPWDR